MNKYKKIFSGLGLLSISTLVGASVVACANKKPKASDSSTEAIDQNNNQGNSTTPEQEKPGPNDQGNSSKPKEGENTPGNPAPQAPKTPEKPESPQNPENSTPGTHNQGKTEKPNDTGKSKGEDQNKKEGKTDMPNSGIKEKPEQTPNLMTIDEKVEVLNSLVDKLPYPTTEVKSEDATRAFLKTKIEAIKIKQNVTKEQKINELNELETTFKKYEKTINKYKEIINNDKFKSNKYGESQIKGLNGRLAKLYGEDQEKFSEGELIWNIYETFRRISFGKDPNKNTSGSKAYEYVIVPNDEKDKNKAMFKILGESENEKKNPKLTLEQLEAEVNKIIDFVINIAKKAAELNITKINELIKTESKKPTKLISKLDQLAKVTTLAAIDDAISAMHKTYDVLNTAKNNKKLDEFSEKIDNIQATDANSIKSELDKIKIEITSQKSTSKMN
ncbi:hypothetical protein [Mycoplasmopsis cynos]|uniref:hypothetical protein n=1 Tax=Mycoplasmopsis cynos TaxID=171284 RepID=UPI002AFDD4CF|nr:hypothetical protein [Mycoplasmopsis cynos]WQQ14874.1 hypothetical protein RRG42_00860 [Mycoplasmopsis cynos]